MQIYFTTSIKSGIQHNSEINKILKYLKSHNHTILLRPKLAVAKDIVGNKTDIKDVAGLEFLDEKYSVQDIYMLTQKRMNKADIVIAEMSHGSTGLGYDVAQAIIQNKPVLILSSNKDGFVSNNAIFGSKSRTIITEPYNEDNIEKIIHEFINESKKLLDSKFILIIPPEIEHYLSWAATKKGIRKAEIVRAAIDKFMDHDIDYKKHMSDLNK